MAEVRNFMTSKVLTTASDKTILEAAKLMKIDDVGSIVVVENGKPVAIVTERDFLRRVVAEGLSTQKPVKEIMSYPLVTIAPEESIKHALKLMQERGVRRLPVVKGERLVGIITAADLAKLEPHELL